jgi:amino acid adenylation domain-containing protein
MADAKRSAVETFGAGTLDGLLLRACAQWPERIAVVEDDATATFADLERESLRIAAALARRGVRHGSRVALSVGSGTHGLAAIFGVLRLGAVYVPLPMATPPHRIRAILDDVAPSIVVAEAEAALGLAGQAVVSLHSLLLECPDTAIAAAGATVADDDCWILYTSGSSGRPKGVRGRHGACVNRIEWMWRTQPIESGEVCFQNTAWTTVDSYWEAFGPLGAGVQLRAFREEILRDPRKVVGALARSGIRRICLVPSLLSSLLWLHPDLGRKLPNLIRWIVSGESLTPELLRRFASAHPQASLFNQYGLTESCADVTCLDATTYLRKSVTPIARVPVGHAISGVTLDVLDPDGRPVPDGMIGELVIDGVALANGYWNSPEEEARRFRQSQSGARQLWTGDLARRGADGLVELVGRKDRQVKVRGFRVELDDVEAAIAELPSISEAVVQAVTDGEGQCALQAVIKPAAGVDDDSASVREALEHKLPAYMIPAKIKIRSELPRTTSGKVDRRALFERSSSAEASADILANVIAVWREILAVDTVEPDSDFFALGGHSLKAVRALARLQDLTGIDLPLSTALTCRTPRLIAASIEAKLASRVAAPKEPAPRPGIRPANARESRLWFLQACNPEGSAYNLAFVIALQGPLTSEGVRAALDVVTRRQPALRTRFRAIDGVPFAEVLPDVAITIEEARASPDAQADVVAAFNRRPFDLERAPLARTMVIEETNCCRLLVVSAHHIIADGWSGEILLDDLSAAFAGDTPAPPLDPPEEEIGASSSLPPPVVNAPDDACLPVRAPRMEVPAWFAGFVPLGFERAQSARLRQLAEDLASTPAAILLTTFLAVLARRAGRSSAATAMPVAARTSAAACERIGFMVDLSIVDVDLSGGATFVRAVRRTEDAMREAVDLLENAGGVLRIIDPDGRPADPAHEFTFIERASKTRTGGLVSLSESFFPIGVCRFPASLVVRDDGTDFIGGFEFSLRSLRPEDMALLAAQLRRFVDAVCADPDAIIDQIELDAAREAWDEHGHALVGDGSNEDIVTSFLAAVATHPSASAIRHGATAWTFDDVSRKAESVAATLERLGSPEAVALLSRRIPAVLPAVFGTLATGAMIVPLDPDTPLARLRSALDSRPLGAVLADQECTALAGELQQGLPVLPLESVLGCTPGDRLRPRVAGTGYADGRPAYVLFTSGTTGTPKGVVVTRGNLAAFRAAMKLIDYTDVGDVWLSVNALNFDLVFADLFVPASFGATIWLSEPPGSCRAEDGTAAEVILADGQITHMFTTPSVAWALHQDPRARGRLAGLRRLYICGEPLPTRIAEAVLKAARGEVWNMYGPTETCIASTGRPLRLDQLEGEIVDLGPPLAGENIYLLDKQLRPVPAGCRGEIVIGGLGVGGGYTDAKLGCERFVPDVVDHRPAAAMYLTGDMGLRERDGRLTFCGRGDFQVKVRGHRVELGDIESALLSHSSVERCVCAVQRSVDGSLELAAHIIPVENRPDLEADLRAHLADRLPAYMIPPHIRLTGSLPLSSRGKVDRQALPRVTGRDTEGDEPVHEATERQIAGIFAELLAINVAALHRDSDFFRIGGHSLQAARAAARIETSFGVRLRLRDFVARPTVRQLADLVLNAPKLAVDPVVPVGPDAMTPASPAQERMWFMDQLSPGSGFHNIAGSIAIHGRLDVDTMQRALDRVVEQTDALRIAFTNEGASLFMKLTALAVLPLESADLRRYGPSAVQTADALARRAANRTFDIAEAPLARVLLLRVGEDDWRLVVVVHHIIVDFWSLGLLLARLARAYASEQTGVSREDAARIGYRDAAAWLRDRLNAETRARDLEFWRAALTPIPSPLSLPLARPRPASRSYQGRMLETRIDRDATRLIRSAAAQTGVGVYPVLLALYAKALADITGQSDLVIGCAAAHRPHPDLEGVVGFFVNTLPLRLRVEVDAPVASIIDQAACVVTDALDHAATPFEEIVAAVQAPRQRGVPPLVQTMLVYQTAPWPEVSISGLHLEVRKVDTGFAKFDLTLYAEDDEDGIALAVEYSNVLAEETIERVIAGLESAARSLPHAVAARDATGEVAFARPNDLTSIAHGKETAKIDAVACHLATSLQVNRDRIAVLADSGAVTYAALGVKAGGILSELRRCGVRPGDRVAVRLERGPDLVAAMIATAFCGACWTPLDLGLPDEQLQAYLDLADPAVLIAERSPKQVQCAASLIRPREVLDQALIDPHLRAPDEDFALIFTSGSTGRPKAVLIPEAAVANRLVWCASELPMAPETRVAHRTPIGFVDSLAEILQPLASGATLVVHADALVRDLDRYADALIRDKIERATFTPSLVNALLDTLEESGRRIPALRLLSLSGELLQRAIARRWQALHPAARLVNVYGCTECAADSTWTELTEADLVGSGPAPIGRPIYNTVAVVIDRAGSPARRGQAGELWIGGAGLMKGYRDPSGSVSWPQASEPAAAAALGRLYPTGDLAVMSDDGVLTVVGRITAQLKIRGVRVDPRGIECRMLESGLVSQAAAFIDPRDDQSLAAAVVPAPGIEFSTRELRAYLERTLPPTCRPGRVFVREALPLNRNGKVDMASLTNAVEDVPCASEPQGDTTDQLRAIWMETLGVESVNDDDDFYALGGHSLMAARMVARLRRQVTIDISLEEVLATSRFADMARLISRASNGKDSVESVLRGLLDGLSEGAPNP